MVDLVLLSFFFIFFLLFHFVFYGVWSIFFFNFDCSTVLCTDRIAITYFSLQQLLHLYFLDMRHQKLEFISKQKSNTFSFPLRMLLEIFFLCCFLQWKSMIYFFSSLFLAHSLLLEDWLTLWSIIFVSLSTFLSDHGQLLEKS